MRNGSTTPPRQPVPQRPTLAVPPEQPDPAEFRLRHVAVLIGTTGSYGRGVLRGIAKYNREYGHWTTFFQPQMVVDKPPPGFVRWKGDGILTNHATPAYGDLIERMNVPVISLRLNQVDRPFPYVGPDHTKVGELAASHLLSLGFKRFACYRSIGGLNPGLDERGRAFEAAIRDAGWSCETFVADLNATRSDSDKQRADLAKWLLSLSKPMGLMATNDERGMHVLEACRMAGISVPADIAVIGVDNDELLCDLSIPPLSSVDVNPDRVGYEAAAALDALMNGRPLTPGPTYISPRGIVTRRSTDAIASEDPELNRAVNFIRENSSRRISVTDVLSHVQVSRTSLQQRMKSVLGHTIHEEIERVRLIRLKELLVSSNMTIKQLAIQTGFSSVQYMTRVFRAAVGETPARFRRTRGM
ncbi:MAG: transcriptional regulator [Phycisphaerales bacterium]|nr:transcriptional regulator [Phycisphaerales bacterium]